MIQNLIKINKKSFLALFLSFTILFSMILPTVNATEVPSTSAEDEAIKQKIEEYNAKANEEEEKKGIRGDIIDFSKMDFSKGGTIVSESLTTQGGLSLGGYEIKKEGHDYTIILNNLTAKKIILPIDDADAKETSGIYGAYSGEKRETNITIILQGENKITGYGIEGSCVKSVKIEGSGNLSINAFSEPKAESVNVKKGDKWEKTAELNYYTKAGISIETGDKKYNEYTSAVHSDDDSLVFAGTGNITIDSPNYYGIINNGDVVFKSGNIKVTSKKSAISAYRILVGDESKKEEEKTFSLELNAGEKAFYDKPTFMDENLLILAGKSAGESAAQNATLQKNKKDVENSYEKYRYIKAYIPDEENAPEIKDVEENKAYCELPRVTVTDDTAIDTITVNGVEINNFGIDTAQLKTFYIPDSNNDEKVIVAKDVLGNEKEVKIKAHITHQLGEAEKSDVIEATCTTEGSYINSYSCTVCHQVITREKKKVAPKGHNFSEWEKQEGKEVRTCKDCGYKEEIITVKDISKNTISLSETSYTYDGTEKRPTVTVKEGNKVLANGRDYTVKYSNNVNSGTATVTVTGNNDYKGTLTANFEIKKRNNSITASNFTKNYSTKAQSFSIGAKQAGNAKLKYSSDNKNVKVDSNGKVTIAKGFAGKATITITADATQGYNKATKKITITMKKINNSVKASNFTKNYSTKAQSFSIGAKQTGNAKLKYSSDNKNVKVNGSGKVTIAKGFIGKATITITANATEGYNKATKKITITVNPPAIAITKLSNTASKKMTVQWKKNTAITGYQIQYSTDKNFKKGVKTITVKKNSTTSTTISKLTKNKKYYVRIRSYKTVSKVNYYSSWSVKNIKINK